MTTFISRRVPRGAPDLFYPTVPHVPSRQNSLPSARTAASGISQNLYSQKTGKTKAGVSIWPLPQPSHSPSSPPFGETVRHAQGWERVQVLLPELPSLAPPHTSGEKASKSPPAWPWSSLGSRSQREHHPVPFTAYSSSSSSLASLAWQGGVGGVTGTGGGSRGAWGMSWRACVSRGKGALATSPLGISSREGREPLMGVRVLAWARSPG